MPKVDRSATKATTKRKRATPVPPTAHERVEEVRISSVIFGLVIIAALMVAGAAWMGGSLSLIERRAGQFADGTARTLGLAVEYVVVEGVPDPLADEVRAAALVEPGENMFRADPHILRQRIEATRLVVNVRVHRFWPNHILILADAAEPVAIWRSNGQTALIDTFGQRVAAQDARTGAGLLTISGEGAPVGINRLIKALEAVPALKGRVAEARRISGRRWDLALTSGGVIRLPDDVDLEQALARLNGVHGEVDLFDRALDYIDARAPQRLFIKPSHPVTAALTAHVEGG